MIVDTAYGRIQGVERGRHLEFLGVPFAAPPVGPLRFAPPRPPEPWDGVRDATAFAPSAPQIENKMQGFFGEGPKDEDCLYLNVWTPAADQARRPVLFWIHGGGFTNGSGSQQVCDGSALVERGDVVVVSIHYRLGALGFLVLDDCLEGATANAGLLDMVAALEWVRDHIGDLGGDPGNVTIFGESAGATAVMTLMAMPAARGLFHRAIMQSGSGRFAPLDEARVRAQAMLAALGLDASTAERIRDVPVDRLLATQVEVENTFPPGQRLGAVRDGKTIFASSPLEAMRAGTSAGVPLLIGTNRDEMKLWGGWEPGRAPIPDDALAAEICARMPVVSAEAAPALIDLFRESRRELGLPHENTDVFDAVWSGVLHHAQAIRFADAQSQHAPVYRYLFTWESPANDGAMGACHALEIPFVFGNLDRQGQRRMAGPPPDPDRLSEQMMDAWIAFARTGNPSHEGIGAWSPYDSAERPTMILGRECGLEDNPLGVEFDAVLPLVPA